MSIFPSSSVYILYATKYQLKFLLYYLFIDCKPLKCMYIGISYLYEYGTSKYKQK